MRKFSTFLFIIFLLLVIFYFLSINKTSYWVCQNGQWLKKGNPNYPQPKVSCPKKISLPETKQECEKQGGVWKKWGLAPAETCNKKTTVLAHLVKTVMNARVFVKQIYQSKN